MGLEIGGRLKEDGNRDRGRLKEDGKRDRGQVEGGWE